MDFLEKLFEKHGSRTPERHDEHGWPPARPHREDSRGPSWSLHESAQEHGKHRAYDGRLQGEWGRHGLLRVLSQHKTLAVVAALLVLAVLFGGIVAVMLALALFGASGALAGIQDLTALVTDLPRLVTTLLVDVPKALLDYLAPLLQLKSTLEGKA